MVRTREGFGVHPMAQQRLGVKCKSGPLADTTVSTGEEELLDHGRMKRCATRGGGTGLDVHIYTVLLSTITARSHMPNVY